MKNSDFLGKKGLKFRVKKSDPRGSQICYQQFFPRRLDLNIGIWYQKIPGFAMKKQDSEKFDL